MYLTCMVLMLEKRDDAGARAGCIGRRRQTREGARVATYKYIYQKNELMSGMNGR